jgi:hypothetical protein
MRRVPGHPRSSGGGYVFEHILVMEEILGLFSLGTSPYTTATD